MELNENRGSLEFFRELEGIQQKNFIFWLEKIKFYQD
jgi:hypothetical protein